MDVVAMGVAHAAILMMFTVPEAIMAGLRMRAVAVRGAAVGVAAGLEACDVGRERAAVHGPGESGVGAGIGRRHVVVLPTASERRAQQTDADGGG